MLCLTVSGICLPREKSWQPLAFSSKRDQRAAPASIPKASPAPRLASVITEKATKKANEASFREPEHIVPGKKQSLRWLQLDF